jgi:hypothetical protein
MAEWRTVPAESGYWHPINRGFTQSNAKFMCSECGVQIPLPVCPDCGCDGSQLGTSMGLPGVFCEQCGSGGISWKCPSSPWCYWHLGQIAQTASGNKGSSMCFLGESPKIMLLPRAASCGNAHKSMLIFYYDILSIKVRKKRFWE